MNGAGSALPPCRQNGAPYRNNSSKTLRRTCVATGNGFAKRPPSAPVRGVNSPPRMLVTGLLTAAGHWTSGNDFWMLCLNRSFSNVSSLGACRSVVGACRTGRGARWLVSGAYWPSWVSRPRAWLCARSGGCGARALGLCVTGWPRAIVYRCTALRSVSVMGIGLHAQPSSFVPGSSSRLHRAWVRRLSRPRQSWVTGTTLLAKLQAA
jgi:hypothetical protein